MFNQTIGAQAQQAYNAALSNPAADWRAVAELFRATMRPERIERAAEPKTAARSELADYNIDRIKLKCRSPRIAVQFMDGEAVFTHVPSAPGRLLNVGRALRVAIAMYRSRTEVQKRLGFPKFDRAIPVPAIFQVRCLETDELFDPDLCNEATAREREGTSTSASRVTHDGRELCQAASAGNAA